MLSAKKKRAKSPNVAHKVYQLKITLLGIEPPIWRRVLVRDDTLLSQLDVLVQAAMGWDNSHLHHFLVKGVYYANPEFELESCEDEESVELKDVLPRARSKIFYEYDFGDGWKHEIRVEKITTAEKPFTHPVCLDGRRACPPEDCGGVWGYEELLEILKDPKHEEFEERREWIGGEFDPESFDIDDVNRLMEKFTY